MVVGRVQLMEKVRRAERVAVGLKLRDGVTVGGVCVPDRERVRDTEYDPLRLHVRVGTTEGLLVWVGVPDTGTEADWVLQLRDGDCVRVGVGLGGEMVLVTNRVSDTVREGPVREMVRVARGVSDTDAEGEPEKVEERTKEGDGEGVFEGCDGVTRGVEERVPVILE